MEDILNSIPSDDMEAIKDHLFNLLTAGTYVSLTAAIRECISNSYDANADNVTITFDPKELVSSVHHDDVKIQIVDDGVGMNGKEFWAGFASIATSTKDPTKLDKSINRYAIGQFGIGAFALTPYVREFIVYSKKYNHEPIQCKVNARKINNTSGIEFQKHIRDNIIANYISDKRWKEIYGSSDPGCVIYINGVNKEEYQAIINGDPKFWQGKVDIYKEEKHLTRGIKEMAWHLSTILPLQYDKDDGGVYRDYKRYILSKNPSINVKLSGIKLTRKLFSQKQCTVTTIDYNKNNIVAKGVIIANSSTVKPNKANGIMIRLNNVGIGTYSFHSFRYGNRPAESRVTGEIHIEKGLHNELNNSRDGFREYGEKWSLLKDELYKNIEDACKNANAYSTSSSNTKSKSRISEYIKGFGAVTKKQTIKAASSSPRQTRRSKPSGISGQSTTGKSKSTQSSSSKPTRKVPLVDPISSVNVKDNKIQIDENHPIFKAYYKKKEKELIIAVLLALKTIKLDTVRYHDFINNMIEIKKGEL